MAAKKFYPPPLSAGKLSEVKPAVIEETSPRHPHSKLPGSRLEYGSETRFTAPRINWMAISSFLLALLLLAFGVVAIMAYRSPRTGPNWEALGWGISVFLTLSALSLACATLGPLAVTLASVALWQLRRDSGRYIAKCLAGLSIILSCFIIVSTFIAVQRVRGRMQTAAPTVSPAVQASRMQVWGEQTKAHELRELCDSFAASHDAVYPPDVAAISDWIDQKKGYAPVKEYLKDFDYFGRDVPYVMSPTPAQSRDENQIILFIGRNVLPDGTQLVVVCGDAHQSSYFAEPASNLALLVKEYNRKRVSLNLPPIVWPSGAAPTQPASQP